MLIRRMLPVDFIKSKQIQSREKISFLLEHHFIPRKITVNVAEGDCGEVGYAAWMRATRVCGSMFCEYGPVRKISITIP